MTCSSDRELADSLVRCEVGVDRCFNNPPSARDRSRRGQDAHPADHGIKGDEVLHLRLVGQHGIAIDFRCCNDEILVELLSLREFVNELANANLPNGLAAVLDRESMTGAFRSPDPSRDSFRSQVQARFAGLRSRYRTRC